jgi:IS5 family transposase
MKQQTLAVAADQNAGFERFRKPTRRDEFLQTMDAIIPWAELCAVIEPLYPKGVGGRPPIGLQRMLRIHFVQHWFNLADVACEEALYDSTSLRRFVGIDLGHEPVPDATTMLKFRRLLNDNKLGEKLFAKVGEVLQSSGYGDSAYSSQQDLIASKAPHAKDFTNERVRNRLGEVDEVARTKNRNKSRIRARVEHVFCVVKRLWGFNKVRYRGLAKNATRAFTALALANIFLARGPLMAQVRP